MPPRADRIDLTYRDDVLTGVLAGRALELPVELPVSIGSTFGTYGAALVAANWDIGSNYNAVEVPATLDATFDDHAIKLTATFLLADPNNPVLLGATVTGSAGPDAVTASASPGLDSRSVVIDGHFGVVAVSIAATIARDLSKGTIAGTINGERAKLAASRSQSDYPTIRIKGQVHGPASLGLLMTVGLLYFL